MSENLPVCRFCGMPLPTRPARMIGRPRQYCNAYCRDKLRSIERTSPYKDES